MSASKPDDVSRETPLLEDAGPVPKKHYIRTSYIGPDDRQYWECSCGRGGSVPGWKDVDEASDEHINYGAKERRIDVSSPTEPGRFAAELAAIEYDRYGRFLERDDISAYRNVNYDGY